MRELSEIPTRLLRAIQNAPLVQEKNIDHVARFKAPARHDLTSRELEVVRCLSHGMTQQMAGDTLGISQGTVHTHLESARYRLAAKNTTHLVALALRLRLIS